MIDYSLKKDILESGLYSLYLQFRKYIYREYGKRTEKEIELALNGYGKLAVLIKHCLITTYSVLFNDGDLSLYKECVKLYNANKARLRRIKKRVSSMLENDCLFLTLTFSDKTLNTTTREERREYIVKTLKTYSNVYVANIDFGKKNKREHYHALVQVDKVDYSLYCLGSINGKKVITKDCTSDRVAKYIAKLSNHAVKSTTCRTALIYSR